MFREMAFARETDENPSEEKDCEEMTSRIQEEKIGEKEKSQRGEEGREEEIPTEDEANQVEGQFSVEKLEKKIREHRKWIEIDERDEKENQERREERCERKRQRKRKVGSWQGCAVITSKRIVKSGKKILKSKGEEKGGEKISQKV